MDFMRIKNMIMAKSCLHKEETDMDLVGIPKSKIILFNGGQTEALCRHPQSNSGRLEQVSNEKQTRRLVVRTGT